jgi:medium-chain acyl-[acyl-carrier-protein] hydrolase
MTLGPAVWTETVQVRAYDCDFLDRWKPVSMLQSMQEVANKHATSLGLGFDDMTSQNQAWVLSRIKVRFFEMPLNGETITIKTFPKGIQQKIFFTRDFLLTNNLGKVVAAASTAWLVIDYQARRMLLPSSLKVELPITPGLVGLDEPLEKISLPEKMDDLWDVVASYSTVDIMGHVNNTRYIEWATDCFSIAHFEAHHLDWLQINYTNEVKPGEHVKLSHAPSPIDPSIWLVQGINQAKNNRSFEAALGWSPR